MTLEIECEKLLFCLFGKLPLQDSRSLSSLLLNLSIQLLSLTTFNNMNQNQLSISYLIRHQVKQNLMQSKRIFIYAYNISNVITFVANM